MECILAWVFLIVGVASKNADYFIASGVFAIASNISRYKEGEIK